MTLSICQPIRDCLWSTVSRNCTIYSLIANYFKRSLRKETFFGQLPILSIHGRPLVHATYRSIFFPWILSFLILLFCIPRHWLYLLNARFMSRICELVEREIYSLETGETDELRLWQISGTSPLFPTRRIPWYMNTKIPIELCNHIYANQPQ